MVSDGKTEQWNGAVTENLACNRWPFGESTMSPNLERNARLTKFTFFLGFDCECDSNQLIRKPKNQSLQSYLYVEKAIALKKLLKGDTQNVQP